MTIHFLVTPTGEDTIAEFLEHWAPGSLRRRFRVLHYGELHALRAAPPGAWIFSDIERLRPGQRRVAAALEARLRAAPATHRVLNSPARTLTRYPLLRLLHERGDNAFQVHRADRGVPACRFPVFVRCADDHRGSRTGIVRDEAELRTAIESLDWMQERLEHSFLIVTEFCDTSGADGLYRKYSLMRVGPAVVPRHVLFSREWVTKNPDLVEPELADEEARFVDGGTRTPDPSAAFDLAAIDYGRVDYGVLRGRAQVWEINTNPMLIPHAGRTHELRRAAQRRSAERVIAAFNALDADLEPGADVPVFGLRDARGAGVAATERAMRWVRWITIGRRRAARERAAAAQRPADARVSEPSRPR